MNVNWSEIKPYDDELPVCYANRMGQLYTKTVSTTFKKNSGQFFTPIAIAQFMSKQITNPLSDSISILDPGCGTAILSCSAIEYLTLHTKIRNIKLVTYETDINLIPVLEQVLKYIKIWGEAHKVNIEYYIYNSDFILSNYSVLYPDMIYSSNELKKFDLIISNPPYFKLSKEDIRVKAAQCIIDGQPNIYSIFMAISTLLLTPQGQMIYITPRSFTSGRYFRLFRNFLFKHIQIDFIHLFNTRKNTFSKDNILQETLIMKCSPKQHINNYVTLSYSEELADLDASVTKKVEQEEMVDLTSKEQIIHLPINTEDEKLIRLFKSWDGNLNKYHIQISTGPVVAFRTKESLEEKFGADVAPLYWLHNVTKMVAIHPIDIEDKNKEQFIRIDKNTISTLLPNKNYVLLRRFSSKDDNSRLIAAPYFGNVAICPYVGIENKLNYIYRPKGHLNRMEVIGIAALLNSTLFDNYFRTFNGNVNVSATELREMPMPPLEVIENIGKELISMNDFSMENINDIVNKHFNII